MKITNRETDFASKIVNRKAKVQSPHPLDRESALARLAHFNRRGQFSHYCYFRTAGYARQALDGLTSDRAHMEVKVDGEWHAT